MQMRAKERFKRASQTLQLESASALLAERRRAADTAAEAATRLCTRMLRRWRQRSLLSGFNKWKIGVGIERRKQDVFRRVLVSVIVMILFYYT